MCTRIMTLPQTPHSALNPATTLQLRKLTLLLDDNSFGSTPSYAMKSLGLGRD